MKYNIGDLVFDGHNIGWIRDRLAIFYTIEWQDGFMKGNYTKYDIQKLREKLHKFIDRLGLE